MSEENKAPDFWETGTGKRLKTITNELQRRVTEGSKNALIDHRSKLPAIFKDEDLWRKKQAWVIAGMCLHLVITGQAVKLVESEASIVDWQNAHRFFLNRTAKESAVYLPALAERLKTEIRNHKDVKSELDQLLFSADLPNPLPTDFQWLENGLLIGLALDNFEKFTWPDLPEPEKRILQAYLLTEQQRGFARLWEQVSSLSVHDQEVAHQLLGRLRYLPLAQAEKLIADDTDTRLALYFRDFIEKYRRGFLPKKEPKYQPYVELQDRLKSEGRPHDIRAVIMSIEKKKRQDITEDHYIKTRQGMNRYRHSQKKSAM